MTEKKNKPIMRPYISLDKRYGEFEGRFEEWYLAQDARSTKMKEMLSIGFGIYEANPMLYSMLLGCAQNAPLTMDVLTRLVNAVSGLPNAPAAQTTEASTKTPDASDTEKPIMRMIDGFNE